MRKLKLFFACLLMAVLSIGQVWAGEAKLATLDFTSNTSWGFPSGSGNGITTATDYSDGTYTINVSASTKYYYNTNGYLMIGKNGSQLKLPAFTWTTTKIVVTGKSGASSDTKQNIYVGTTAVSTETTGSAETKTYNIASEFQAAGNEYIFQVCSNHNAQVTKIEIYGEAGGGTNPGNPDPTPDPTDDADVTLNLIDGNWGFPTSNTTTDGTYTNSVSGYSVTCHAPTNYKVSGSDYFFIGKSGAYILLPVFSNPIEKIVVAGNSGGSADVAWNIYQGETAVSTQATGCKNDAYTFDIAPANQKANVAHSIKVTNAKNLQIKTIKIYFGEASSKQAAGLAYDATDAQKLVKIGGSLTAPTLSNENNLTVSYASNNTDVVEVNASTGAITAIKAAGKAVITASFEGNDDFYEGEASYTIFVATEAGTAADPLSEASAVALIDLGCTMDAHVNGLVLSQNSTNYTVTLTNGFQFYKAKDLGNVAFESAYLAVGDEVTAFGKLSKFGTTNYIYELAEGCYLTFYEQATATLTPIANDKDHPYTVAQVLAFAAAPTTYDLSDHIFIQGEVYKVNSFDNNNGTYNIYIKDAGTSENDGKFEFFKCSGLYQVGETAVPFEEGDVQVGNIVIGYGVMTWYSGGSIWEFGQPNQLVDLQKPVTGVQLAATAEVKEGSTINLTATILPSNATGTIDWSVESGDAYASVDAGVVSGIAEGESVIRATVHGTEIYAECTVTVNAGTPVLTDYYEKVTATENITDGTYLIVYEGDNNHTPVAFNGALETLEAVGNNIPVTITNDKKIAMTESTEASTFFIDVTAGSIQSASGKYIGANSYGNRLDQSEEASTYVNALSIDDDGNAVISISNTSWDGDLTLRYNYGTNNGERFRYYKSGQQPIALYKLANETVKANPELAWSNESVELTIDGEFTAPTLSHADGITGTISYESDNEAVATVDANGAISLTVPHATGIAHITASYAGDENFKSGTAVCTITVNATAPVPTYTMTFNMAKASYDAASDAQVVWNSNVVTMTADQNDGTKVTNYLAGNYSGTTLIAETRFYAKNSISFVPQTGVTVTKVEWLATEKGYATKLASETFDNATAAVDGTNDKLVVITPTAAGEFSVTLTDAARAKSIVVYYQAESEKDKLTASITIDNVNMEVNDQDILLTAIAATSNPNKKAISYEITSGSDYVSIVGENASQAFHAVAAGTATITATIPNDLGNYNGATTTFNIVVAAASKSLANLAYDVTEPIVLIVGNPLTPATLTYADGFDGFDDITYESSNPNVATVTEAGVVELVENAIGTTTITATLSNSTKYYDDEASYTITVNEAGDDLSGTWTRVTAVAAGQKIIIAGTYNSKTMAMGKQNSNNRAAVLSTLAEDVLTPGNATKVFTLVDAGEGLFAIQTSNGKYLNAAGTGNSNYLREADDFEDASAKWTITFDENGANIVATSTGNRNVIRYNSTSNNELFSCYAAGGQRAINIYSTTSAPEPPTPSTPDYTRGVTAGNYGTICLPQAGVISGATLFEIANYENNTIYIDEILSGELVAGRPYIFQATADQLTVTYTSATVVNEAGNANGLYGFYDLTDEDAKENLVQDAGNYILYQNAYWLVSGRAAYIANYRAYIKIGQINNTGNQAPGRRRVAMTVHNEQTTTDIDALNASETPVKMIIDGQLFIIRGEKMYNVNGQVVK